MSTAKSFHVLAAALALITWVSTCHALKSDKEKPIEVSANSAERDERLGLTTYTGKVVIKQGSLLIEADQVIIKTIISKKNSIEELQEIFTTGQPSHFQQQIKTEGDLVDATAHTIIYRVADKKVDLIEDAVVKQQGRVITGDKISYDVNLQRVTANGQGVNSTTPGRVTVIIPPKPREVESTAAPESTKTN
jgi:lipopolysaccharide export system protein LptA